MMELKDFLENTINQMKMVDDVETFSLLVGVSGDDGKTIIPVEMAGGRLEITIAFKEDEKNVIKRKTERILSYCIFPIVVSSNI